MSNKPIRVAIVDAYPCIRDGLRQLFAAVPELEVVLVAENGLEYERLVAEVGHVHVAVIELHGTGRDGYETIRWMDREHPRTKCVVFSSTTDPASNRRVLRCGGRAMINKCSAITELVHAILAVAANGFYYNAEVTKAMRLRWEDEALKEERDMDRMAAKLTTREKEFLLIYTRRPFPTLKAMEVHMGLTANGVEDLRRRVVKRAGCSLRHEMMDFVYRTGLK